LPAVVKGTVGSGVKNFNDEIPQAMKGALRKRESLDE
jgi:hypothetical protein